MAAAVLQRLVLAAGFAGFALFLFERGWGWLLAVVAAGLVWQARRRRWPGSGDTHGTARFATAQEARAAGMTSGPGIHLGRLIAEPPSRLEAVRAVFTASLADSPAVIADLRAAGRGRAGASGTLWLTKFNHCVILGKTGAGKGAALLVPTLLTWPGPALVFDPKAEVLKLTFEARVRMGRRPFVIDPFRVACPGGGDSFNPLLTGVDPGDPQLPDYARDLATALVVRTPGEQQPYFNDMATVVLTGFCLLAMHDPSPAMRNLITVADTSADPVAFKACVKAMAASPAFGNVLRRLGHQSGQLEDRERAAVLSSVTTHLSWLNSQMAAEAVETSSFDPLWLKQGNADLFIVMPPERIASAKGLLRFLLTGIIRRLISGGLDTSVPVLCVIDEAATLGHLEILENAVTLLRGWGVKFCFVFQSLGQLQDCFPGEKARTFLANTAQIHLKTNDLQTAKEISERIGSATVLSTSAQSGGGSSWATGATLRTEQQTGQRSTSWSVTRSETARPLVRPEEVLAAPDRALFVFADGVPPVLATQVRYYEREFSPGPLPTATGWRRLVVAAAVVAAGLALWAYLHRLPPHRPYSAGPDAAPHTPAGSTGPPAGGSSRRPGGG